MKDSVKKELIAGVPTPFYVLDESELLKRVGFLKSALSKRVNLCYAVKANSFISPLIDELVERFEICSPGELAIALKQGLNPEKLVISGVNKDPEDIEKLILSSNSAGHYTAESISQFKLLSECAKKSEKPINVLLRLTSANQFGMNEEDILGIIKNNENEKLVIKGVQFFSGTQKTSLKKFKREFSLLEAFLERIKEETGFKVEELEYGTGFPVSYFDGENFDEEQFLKEFNALLEPFCREYEVTLELGRSIAASCGSYFTKAVDVKTNASQNFAIMDGGIHHITYFGQFMAMKHPILEQFPQKQGEVKQWNLCGSLCTVNDILVKDLPLTEFEVGDTVIFKNAGAYCLSEGISLFLSRALPGVILLKKDGSISSLREAADTFIYNF